MPDPSYEREQAVALAAVRAAARLCRSVQQRMAAGALEKADRTPVTVADFGSQALICRALHEAFPDDPIIAEEDAEALRRPEHAALLGQIGEHVCVEHAQATGEDVCLWIDYGNAQRYHDRFWTLDPIDGTKGFLRGDQYAVALALIVEGAPAVAALACPNLANVEDVGEAAAQRALGCVFTAVRGQGAAGHPVQEEGAATSVQVSRTERPEEARFCESFVSAHSSHEAAVTAAERLGITQEPVRIDSQAKYALVARGEADIYLRLPRGNAGGERYVERIWDHAAGMLVVEEAGGQVTDVNGRPLNFTCGPLLEKNRGVVATNGRLHEAVLEALPAVIG